MLIEWVIILLGRVDLIEAVTIDHIPFLIFFLASRENSTDPLDIPPSD